MDNQSTTSIPKFAPNTGGSNIVFSQNLKLVRKEQGKIGDLNLNHLTGGLRSVKNEGLGQILNI